jgi:hypothetical protein
LIAIKNVVLAAICVVNVPYEAVGPQQREDVNIAAVNPVDKPLGFSEAFYRETLVADL